ncbi:MAG TPA: arginase family protein [Actinomycetota bacterium]
MDLASIDFLRPAPPVAALTAHDPDVVRAAEWLARSPDVPGAFVLGVPFAGGSISRAQCDLAPAAVRVELARYTVWSSDHGLSLEPLGVRDAGDVEAADGVEEMQLRVENVVRALLAQSDVPLVLIGGDNSVTVGATRGAQAGALLTFDAHHDCRDPARGATNGSPVRQLVEGGLTAVAQIGIHGFANAEPHARWAMDHRIHWVTADQVHGGGIDRALEGALRFLGHAERIWVDFDLDVLDRAFAPGAAAALPGGLLPANLERAAFTLGKNPRIVGIDIAEVDPAADVGAVTVRAACSILLAFLAGVASR